jgi:UDP-2-acetamido-2-deoxy-ribo-hexuluronate aminotransferase
MEFCNLKAQYKDYQLEIDTAMQKVIESAYFINGPEVKELELNLTEFVGSNAITCANGTDAIQIALMAIGVKPGDEIITTPFTFIATGEMIALMGAKPVFVDICEDDFNINPSLIEAAITDKTKAIIPVSLYGQPADMDKINAIGAKYNITVIEDAAQSFGASYKGKRSCNLSNLATTSFFPAKPLGCYGDGGALFTNNDELADKIRMIKNHGQSKRYHHSVIGVNSRLDTLQAAILIVKLKYYDAEIKKRNNLANRYNELLSDIVLTPNIMKDSISVWAQYTIRTQNRNDLQEKLKKHNIPTAVHYPKPLHLQKTFAYLGGKEGQFPISEKISNEVMSLPMSAHLTEIEQEDIGKLIKEYYV